MDVDEILEEDFEEGSDDADNEFQYLNDPSSTQPSSGPPSTPNSCTSSPPINHSDESPVSTFYSQNGNTLVFSGGKPSYGPKRGPGRPRKEYPGMRGAVRDARTVFKRSRGNLKGTPVRKKFTGKDERQSSLINNNGPHTSQDGNGFMFMSSKSPTNDFMNNSMESNVSSEIADKSLQFVEEPPYFPEKWPGKVCALCNLGERSQLGQGEMLRMEITEEDRELFRTDSPNSDDKEAFSNDMNSNLNTFPQISNRRQKGLNKCKNPVNTSEYVDELDKIGHFEPIEMAHLMDNNYYFIHRSCATWSSGVIRDPTGALSKVAYAVSQSLKRKCSYCGHFGASVSCKMACPKFFHYPCVAASGGFQTIQSYISFCKEHLGQVPIICTDDINCRRCCGLGDVSNLVMCSICGDHYHGTCEGLPQLPGVRTGWQCTSCHKCQICRVPDTNEGRSLSCEQCHKVYHANCLRPIMSSIPKYGWKCRRCRVCSDCGSRTPGAGASSRWHAHYTVCDSCYQQRNKGFSCPICHRAYRAAAYREMVKCSLCNKFVHSTCDSEADLAVYHARKENNPDYDYECPPCKQLIQSGRFNQALARRNSNFDEDLLSGLQESCQGPDDLDSPELEKNSDFGLGKGKPYAMKVSKKRIGPPFGQLNKGRGKLGFGKRSRLSDLGRKRGPKTKMRGIFGIPGLSLQRPMAEANKVDDEPGIENRLVLCSAKDKFILTQDICVMCGAIGTDYEGCLISCAQCGQCYHPYCVNVKVTKVILKKGWRCLDCTVCEGCGDKNDEARLILCDECDISYHIYCMDPPLEHVPQGNWKCKWCAVCQKCGRESPGKNCTWKNSYSECGPCASQAACAVCSESYNDGELVIQCANCERWLHCKCDMIKNEEDADKCDDDNYHCVLCRPKDVPPLHLMPEKRETPTPKPVEIQLKLEEPLDVVSYHGLEGSHFIDGVFLSEHGLSSIKSLQMEYIRKKRKQKVSTETNNKEAGILASIESVVAGSGVDALNEDTKVELLDPKEEAEIYKDGMVWERSDGSPPEGFALCTNEKGVVVLRKKRQRNLQKLGIGGFNVRNRTMKKDKDDMDEHTDITTAGGGSNENTPTDKKKKPIRKRQKNKLAETYPVYLQEAFFGKSLLDTTKSNFESDSSDDDTKSNVSDDKIVKLTPEELKMLESVKNNNKGNTTPNAGSTLEGAFTEVKNIMLKSNTSENSLQLGVSSAASQGEDDNDNDPDADTLKDILLDSDLVNSIINDGDDLVKNSDLGVQFDSNVGTRKDDLPDILGPNFNLDSIGINSKDVEEIFQGVINPEPKQYTNIIKQEDAGISLSANQFPKATTPTEIQQFVSNGGIEDVKPPLVMNNFLPVQSQFSNNDIQNLEQVQVHSTSSTPTQSFVNQNPPSAGSNSSMGFTSNASVPNVWSSNSQSPRQSVDFSASQSEDSVASAVATDSGSMKSTEKMRRDEELGEMATKAAVLYANTNHPELKLDFPNWSDRQKQIYKRWRQLPSEKKAPFLQQARDNRTALRMRKNQQDQEKIASQQKSLKEQEQERQWKQLQAMRAKEQQLQQFSSQASDPTSPSIMPSNTPPNFMQDQNISMEKRSPYSSIPGTPRPQFNTDVIQPTVYATHLDTYQPPSIQLNSPVQDKVGPIKQQENKQLRDLLQRQESIGGLLNNSNTILNVSSSSGTQQTQARWNSNNDNAINSGQSQQFSGSTFREPFPVMLQGRNTKVISNNPNVVRMSSTNVDMNNSTQQFNHTKMTINMENQCETDKKLETPPHLTSLKLQAPNVQSAMQARMKIKENPPKIANSGTVGTEIPDNVTAELEKLEHDENVAIGEVEGVGDILGGLGEDDDDELLKSLTADMGADFNILEYADPELDALTGGDNQNLLDKLDFDEGDPELKKTAENRFAVQQRTESAVSGERQNVAQSAIQNQVINQAPPRYNNSIVQQSNMCSMPPRATLPPPPPPYPGPPPPYPANTKNVRQQEQPLLLEDLVEQEKREQQQQQLSSAVAGQLNEKKTFIAKVEIPHRSATPMHGTWRKNSVEILQNSKNIMMNLDQNQKKEILNFNCQPAPQQPPEIIITEQDRILQINYEQWLNTQNVALESQLKHFEEKITKIRKSRKSLNSKQRLVKKSGGELPSHDAKELAKIIAEQPGIQKQLDHAKKQYRQHGILMQEYKNKHLAKIQMPSPNIPSPAQMTPHSPMLSPSTNSQSSIQLRTSPSPLSAHMLQSARSPIQSPSPLLSHSPGGISQSPVHQSNSNPSPFNTIIASPRIGTPHSQMDENSYSPSAAAMSSPSSLPGRHASPAPRITSPQHRINIQQLPTRIATSPGHSYSGILPTQNSKFNPPHSHHDRIRVQIGQQQQLLHQSQMSIDGQQQQTHLSQQQQQHIVTSLQMSNFQQQSMHLLQQRQIMQRQVSQNIINQAMNKPKSQQQNPVSSPSPSQVSPSPSSPLLQCSLQQNPNSNNFVLNSPDQQYSIQQCGEVTNPMVELKNFSRGSQDNHNNGNNASRGGGLSNLNSGFLPYTGGGTSSKYGKIRLGLFGGSPMWNLSNNVTQKINIERAKCSGEKSTMEIDKSSDKEKLLDGSSAMTNNSNQISKNEEEVVVIDSSPDEKQRIMDYDDFQDKGFVTTEVSLSSVAQNIVDNDDITVIESFTPSELTDIVSSPLETEAAEEYVLFSSDVVDYADSDDSLKPNIMAHTDDLSKRSDSSFEKDFDLSKTESKLEVSENNICSDKVVVTSMSMKKEPVNRSVGSHDSSNLTSQDFEAMIDSKVLKEGIVATKSTAVEVVQSNMNSGNTIAKSSHISHIAGSNVMTINTIPFTTIQGSFLSSNLTQTTNSTTVKVTPKKVNDVGTATTKVSYGNTISVPLLKNVTISSPHILTTDKQAKIPTTITLTKQPTILNVRGPKLNPTTIVSLSSLQLKPATNAKIVQATVVGKKIHLPQTAVENLANAQQNLIHTLNSKLSTFTVLQDMPLPNKIFEDEPTSPEMANENDDTEPTKKPEPEVPQNIIVNKIIDKTPKQKEITLANRIDDQKGANNRMDSTVKEDVANKSESNSNKETQKLQTRLISIVPQLSPLSQPTDITTNMANASQQLRSIMSSIGSNQHDQKPQCDSDMKKESTRTSIEKVEKLLQAAHQSQYQQQQLQHNDEQKDTSELSSSIVKPITSTSNKLTFLLTSSSGATTQFQTIVNSVDLQAKKTKVVVPSVLAARLPSAIVMTSIPSTISTSTSQSVSDSIVNVHNSQEASKKILKSLHAHITSTQLKRSKSTDDGIEREKEVPAQITGTKRYSLEVTPSKTDGSESTSDNSSLSQSQGSQTKTNMNSNADQSFNGCKISTVISQPPRSDDSQNVLLKQLLQNSTGSSTTPSTPPVLANRKVASLRAPSLGIVSSLEAQLARPVVPPVATTPPSMLSATSTHGSMKANIEMQQKSESNDEPTKKMVQVISRETSFVSKPPTKTEAITVQDKTANQQQQQHHQQPHHQQQSNIEISSKSPAPVKLENKPTNLQRVNSELYSNESKQVANKPEEEMRKTPSQVETVETSKTEPNEPPLLKRPNSNAMPFSGSSETPTDDHDHSTKEEKPKSNTDVENSIELKKKKKREYQKNRRQMQLLNKDLSFSKKRARKISKVDGDYDVFTDNLMTNLRQMPPLQVLEPLLSRNYGICPPYGAGDLTKLGNAKEGVQPADMLQGDYGNATSTNIVDFYNTKPFGPLDMPAETPNTTIQNGFYDQEFPPIKFETEMDDRLDYSLRDWDVDTPESIVTSSSPECTVWEPILPFPGLRVINEEDDDEPYNRMSPVVPVIAPIPIKLKAGIDLSIDRKIHDSSYNKENSLYSDWKSRNAQPTTPAKDPNVTVTLTLTSSAAEDIMSVLRDLANILHIPAPTSYQIVERTTTPPSQKLGLYRTKGKDGKEGDPIDIQTILNGTAKFCRHCDVVILNTIIRAKASEFPLLATNNELLNNSDDLYFCSKSCYKQFKWRPTNIIDDNYNINSKLNIALDSNRFPVDGYPDVKSIKVEHSTGDVKNARKASTAGLDDNYHKNKILKFSHEPANKSINQSRTDEKMKNDGEKSQKASRYRYFSPNMFTPPVKYKKPSEKEITDMLFRMNITVAPANKMPDDTRQCIFCSQVGDGVADGPSRLLNFDVDKWVHLNCALWSDGVYETENGALMNLEAALQVSLNQTCTLCHNLGATIKCFKNRCSNVYHLSCAIKDNCTFYKNKTTNCMAHVLKNEKENELTTLSVQRRVYVDRDESRQVAAVMHHSELSNLLRVGSLTFLNVGQLLPHQLQAFHTPNYIYPIGYKIIRFYWSMRNPNKRCRYICSIADVAGRPEFRVIVQEPTEDDIELRDTTPKAVWQRILQPLASLRSANALVRLFPEYVTGEDLFGLTEPAVVRILESLPGIETLTDYRFKYGRNPLLELPLAINPSGAARTEPKQRQAVGWRKPHTQRTGSTNQRIPLAPTTTVAGEVACPYSKQFVHSKSSQYKKMKQEWRNNVFLARSKIQGLGLYAARDLEKHTMVIEYIGEVIRTEVSEIREKQYEARNRGIYMFRLDEDRVVDATLSGGLARYINHSCNPNCVTEIVEVDREYRIIIFAKRRINRGEELSYDYKFDIEDDAHKISCMCGAPNCRKWMN